MEDTSAFSDVKKGPLFTDFQALEHPYFEENTDFWGPKTNPYFMKTLKMYPNVISDSFFTGMIKILCNRITNTCRDMSVSYLKSVFKIKELFHAMGLKISLFTIPMLIYINLTYSQ